MVTFIRDSSDISQLYASPLTKPEMMTNKSTSTLIEVKTLLTQADSFTPNDRSPGMSEKATGLSTVQYYSLLILSSCVSPKNIATSYTVYKQD